MKSNDIALSGDAIKVIDALRHKCGTYGYYTATLGRLFNLILAMGDEIGMDGMEMVHTLRVLNNLNTDLACLAGRECAPLGLNTGTVVDPEEDGEDTAEKVEAAFSGFMAPEGEGINPSACADKEDTLS